MLCSFYIDIIFTHLFLKNHYCEHKTLFVLIYNLLMFYFHFKKCVFSIHNYKCSMSLKFAFSFSFQRLLQNFILKIILVKSSQVRVF